MKATISAVQNLAPNPVTQNLIALGATIYFNHRPENVTDASVVVVSSAVSQDNPELVAAREQRIPVIRRAEMLAELMRFRHGIRRCGYPWQNDHHGDGVEYLCGSGSRSDFC
ncbi:UDP-N-acetylmuramate--L-alanine ligase [Pantoea agglomerans]|uniref:UDP-N-acetylmuramate--L-alanine ligase n=1 Tax=Enterobacter agglomerans TaxID=549 RepID=A0A379AKI6_ENTAG|nr:UDP-N-acetylmuramate--L-alanine ligase [Pantoea agglomerans]